MSAYSYDLRLSNVQSVEITLRHGSRVFGTGKDLLFKEKGIAASGVDALLTEYINVDTVSRDIAFSSAKRNRILPVEISEVQSIFCIKQALLCVAQESDLEIVKRRSSDVFCKHCEAYEVQHIVGDGTVFLTSSGTVAYRDLDVGEILRVDVDCLLAMTDNVMYDYQVVGGDGRSVACVATIQGPGRLWLQSTSYQDPHN